MSMAFWVFATVVCLAFAFALAAWWVVDVLWSLDWRLGTVAGAVACAAVCRAVAEVVE